MTKEQSREAGAVMIAWAAGKTIQWRRRDQSEWHDIEPDSVGINLSWDWDDFEYRVKPETKLRPWTADEVPLGAQLRSKGDTSRSLLGITATDEIRKEWLAEREYSIDGGKTWLPCGVEEESK